MTSVSDSELFVDADRVKDKVVLITGGANGIGKSAALSFGRHGAKVVIGDMDLKGAKEVVSQIKDSGSDAVAQGCDVTSWEDQLSLFQFAMRTYGQIDIVVPCAGVAEQGVLLAARDTAVNGVPTKPSLKTLDINLIAVLYSTRLALYYFLESKVESSDALKTIVFVGSMASFQGLSDAPLYSASKHGLLGVVGSLQGVYGNRIRATIVCPWFADTAIVPIGLKLLMAGIPLTPVSRIGGAILRAATDPDPESNGAVYTLPDHGQTFKIKRAQLGIHGGVYKLLDDRVRLLIGTVSKIRYYMVAFKDVFRIVVGRKSLSLILALAAGVVALRMSISTS